VGGFEVPIARGHEHGAKVERHAIGILNASRRISSGDLNAKKHGRPTIVLPNDLRVRLKAMPAARKPIEESPA
jgi:hypothetical protein